MNYNWSSILTLSDGLKINLQEKEEYGNQKLPFNDNFVLRFTFLSAFSGIS